MVGYYSNMLAHREAIVKMSNEYGCGELDIMILAYLHGMGKPMYSKEIHYGLEGSDAVRVLDGVTKMVDEGWIFSSSNELTPYSSKVLTCSQVGIDVLNAYQFYFDKYFKKFKGL